MRNRLCIPEDEISHVTEEENVQKKDGSSRRAGVLETDGTDSVDNSLFSASLGSSPSRAGGYLCCLICLG